MTDRFEEAVREAAQGLGDLGDSGMPPSYHDAWHRGRRRRVIKQGAMACAGALILVAALSINLGPWGNTNNETTEVAIPALGVTATAAAVNPPATTAPIPTPTVGDAAAATPLAIPSVEVEPTEVATAAPTTAPATPTPAAAASVPAPTAIPTAVPPVATAVPTATTGPPTPTPLPTIDPVESTSGGDDPANLSTGDEDPGSTAADATGPKTDPTTDPVEDGNPETTTAVAPPQDRLANRPVDAVLVATGDAKGLCDTTGDREPDATCELLKPYPCMQDAEARAGYVPTDTDGDEKADTCVASDTTTCDTDRDGIADVHCIIELLPAETGTDGEDQAPSE